MSATSGSHAEHVMGTVVSFGWRGPRPTGLSEAVRSLHDADRVFSTWKPDSHLSRLRRAELSVTDCPAEVLAVVELCLTAKRTTQGWFDPWAGPAFDPTGLVKGWAVQRAAGLLGGDEWCVNGGGDLVARGTWTVGIADPADSSRVVDVVTLTDATMATSGSGERGGHVRDPRTGEAVLRTASVTVTAGPLDLALADVLATAHFAAGPGVVPAVPGVTVRWNEPGPALDAATGAPRRMGA